MTSDREIDVEAAAKVQAEAEEELKELESVIIGLEDEAVLQIAAQKRFDYARTYKALQMDLTLIKASANANERLNNKQVADQFNQKLPSITIDMQHCLRSIRLLDKQYPSVLERMKKMVTANIRELRSNIKE